MWVACVLKRSSGMSNPRDLAVFIAMTGNVWLWHAKHDFCSTCPSAPAVRSGRALSTAERTGSDRSRGGGATGGAREMAQNAVAANMVNSGDRTGDTFRYTPAPGSTGDRGRPRTQDLREFGGRRFQGSRRETAV